MTLETTGQYKTSEKVRARQKLYRENNRDKEATRQARAYQRNKEFIFNYLLTHPCVDCGMTDTRYLQFDHRDGREKKFTVCSYAGSLERLKDEIAKCDVRCYACHKTMTAIRSESVRLAKLNLLN